MIKATICVAMLFLAGPALAADRSTGQGHARKANTLAAAGKCKQAIPEFNAAYGLLKDPALLFNRAECLRKLGRVEQALFDYRKFLREMPSAPNRGVVEGRIFKLDPSSAPVQAKTIVQAPPEAAAPVPAAPVPAAPVIAAPAPAPKAAEPRPSLHAAGLRQPIPAEAPAPMAPLVRAEEPPMVARRPPPEAPRSESHAWIWLSVAAVVVAASAGGALYLAGRPRDQ